MYVLKNDLQTPFSDLKTEIFAYNFLISISRTYKKVGFYHVGNGKFGIFVD